MIDGWCPFAIPCPGPEAKRGYNYGRDQEDLTHAKVGVALHSAEYESTPEWDDYKTLHNALFSDREASWTFSLCDFLWYGQEAAILYQHYPVGTVCWAQGYQGNLWLDSIETERIAPRKLTGPQYELLVKTLRWIGEAHGWRYWYGPGGRGITLLDASTWPDAWLFEHNAVPGAPATNCAVFTNGQIDPVKLIADLKEDDMKPPLFRIEGRPEVYYLAGGKLIHIPDQRTFLHAGYKDGDVAVVDALSPICYLPVEYSRMPDELRCSP